MKILLGEDDKTTAEFVQRGLTGEGHAVSVVADGREALTHCLYNDYDLVILDRMMPEMDGLSVTKALRAAQNPVPIIFLTALGDVSSRVEGLQAGADDYLAKPFHFSELLARIHAVTRRPAAEPNQQKLTVHDLELDLLERVARRGGKTIPLLAKEFRLLETLMRAPGRIFTKTMLLERVWDISFDPGTSVVETHISRLRAKIDKPFDIKLIQTHRNMGYSINAPH